MCDVLTMMHTSSKTQGCCIKATEAADALFIVRMALQVLIWAQLRGNSQNVIKIPAGAIAKDKNAVSPRIARNNGALAVIDGGRSQGMLAMHAATRVAIQRAQRNGSGIIAINNISSATGALGCGPQHEPA